MASLLRAALCKIRLHHSLAVSSALALSLAPHVALDAPQQPPKDITVDPATGLEFPNTLRIPSRVALPQFTLVGVGVRTVSFLGIKVYSVGFYADLANPNLNIPADASFEQKIEHIVKNTACVLRIIPTRNTSYTHLRDGFVKTMVARVKLAKDRGELSQAEEHALVDPMGKLKSMFPNVPLNKGSFLDIFIHPPSSTRQRLIIFRDIGRMEHDWFAHNFFLAYFEGTGISPPMRKSVEARLENAALPLR
ncbi:hypothetical protein EXIGLDRAFT_736828 [Exidia glandulosa HHB12029]|uniref:Chalcone isomerase domain-containing protein n=1 Tax=Exidia glandulosa HHB12029 TaxID=1314781 RepID=A0A165PFR6_EXIGL|nr:hypothetical protein EXIGLDRAFT_736828 [Exidia glandulosa HHB12029]